jgi:periplasmic divalent cation tolerance protein
MNFQYLVVLITAASKEEGQRISTALLEKRLAACVNIVAPINSLYTWEGKINNDEEVLLIAKTRADLFEDEFMPTVKSLHSYEVPEIIALPIVMGSKAYLDWIQEVTGN